VNTCKLCGEPLCICPPSEVAELRYQLKKARELLAEAKEYGGWHPGRNRWIDRVHAFLKETP